MSIKSRPLYAPLQLDPAGRAHLIVSDLDNVPDIGPAPEIWLTGGRPSGPARYFATATALLTALSERLRRETIGLRLYGVGTEAFLWDLHNLAAAAGLGAGEIFLTHSGSLRRRVQCVHCKAMIEAVATSIVACPGCGAQLFVRDHFSRRLAAFMGVAVDAEVPGEIPAPVVLYP